ncbi:hypothetical protein QJT78_52750, partial [Bradyrhizobium sp. Mp27]|nr:hypothetical protein [Bradyrhizobium sp. Mp27]
MRQIHLGGEKVFVDFAGDTIDIVDPLTGEVGSQFTSLEFTDVLLDAKIAISMDGKGAWRDNVFVERL